MGALAFVVVGSQLATVARANEVGAGILERFPRPFYAEFYLPIFYAVGAAYVLHRGWRLLTRGIERGRFRWLRLASLAAVAWWVVGAGAATTVAAWVAGRFSRGREASMERRKQIRAVQWVPALGILTLLLIGMTTWQLWPSDIHPVFAETLLCRRMGRIFCRDHPGLSMGAARTPITEFLAARLDGAHGFAGRADYVLSPTSWATSPEVGLMVEERNRNFEATGNGMLLRALPLQQIPTGASYEPGLDALYYLLWTRYINEGVPAKRSASITLLEAVYPKRLALIGVRYVIARDEARPPSAGLASVMTWRGYTVYELDDPNIGGYGVASVAFGATVTDELRIIRESAFDPRRTATVAAAERGWLGSLGPFSSIRNTRLIITGQTLNFEATAAGARALAVLPFRFSQCWQPTWQGRPGRLLRTDVALLGVAFEERTSVKLAWSAGYGGRAACLRADAALVPSMQAAASSFVDRRAPDSQPR